MVTLPLYQEFAFGALVAAPVMVGGVSSTLRCCAVAVSPLPAESTAVPIALWSAPSPMVRGAVHTAIPESASSHVYATLTSALYQPFWFATRSASHVIDGLVLSTLTIAVSPAELPALSVAVPSTV